MASWEIGDDGRVTSDASAPESGDIAPAATGGGSAVPDRGGSAHHEPGALRPTGRPNARLRQTVRDMVLSLAVVLAAIAVIMAITWRPAPDPVRVVDPAPELALARAQAPYPVLYPADLDPSWRPTSARWEITPTSMPDPAWHVGFVTPEIDYAQLGQSASQDPAYVAEQIAGAEPAGEWNGWLRYDSADQRALVRVDGGVTVVVSGTAPWSSLELLADRLSPTGVPTPAG